MGVPAAQSRSSSRSRISRTTSRTRCGAAERSEVDGAVIEDLPHDGESRCLLPRELDEAEDAVALVLDVEGWPPALDAAHLEEQRGELAGYVLPLDAVRVADDLGRLLAPVGTEVREQACRTRTDLPTYSTSSPGPIIR
jgi:hypothetical protein